MNETYKSRFIGAVSPFGRGYPNIPGIPVYGNIGFVPGLGGVSPVMGKVLTGDNPYQTVDTDPYQRLGSDYSRGIPRFRFARVPERFIRDALRRHIGPDKDFSRERRFE